METTTTAKNVFILQKLWGHNTPGKAGTKQYYIQITDCTDFDFRMKARSYNIKHAQFKQLQSHALVKKWAKRQRDSKLSMVCWQYTGSNTMEILSAIPDYANQPLTIDKI